MRDLARLSIAAFGQQGQGSGVVGVDVQRIRRSLGLRAEPQTELPADDPRHDGVPRDALRRFEALLRRELERAQIERNRVAAAVPAAQRARPRAALGAAAGPRRGAPRRRPAAPPAGHAGDAGPRPSPPRARRRAPHDARLAADRRRAGRAEVPAAPAPPPRDLRAVRRLHERHLGLGVLPLGAARAARLVSQDALVRVHRAHQRGDRHLRHRAQLPHGVRAHRPRTPGSPTCPATPTTGGCGRSSARWSRTTCTRARR